MTTIGVIIPTGLRDTLFEADARAELATLGAVRWWDQDASPTSAQAADMLQGCQVAVGSWRTPNPGTDNIIERLPELRLWEHVAGTVKSFFTDAVKARSNLTVASCKGAIADTVAEYVIGQIICSLRMQDINAADNRRGPSGKSAGLRVLTGATIGVVGASEVGKRVIALLNVFGCRILVCDPFADAADIRARGGELVSDIHEMALRSDAVTLHTPLLPGTTGLMSAQVFASMRDGTIFINTSRGECVDEPALVRELQAGRLRAWLDVTNPEPAAVDSPLRLLPNVTLTSHIAGPPCAHLGRQAVRDIRAFVQGGQPQCVVTPDMLDRIA